MSLFLCFQPTIVNEIFLDQRRQKSRLSLITYNILSSIIQIDVIIML